MRKRFLLSAFITVLALAPTLWALPPYPPPTIIANVIRVVDGDTIEVKLVATSEAVPMSVEMAYSLEGVVRVRYIGMNTPETVHPSKPVQNFGKEASTFNTSLVADKTVYLELDIELWDRYDRLLAYVYLDPQGYAMVNAILVAMGFANVATYPPNVRYVKKFQGLERIARELELGLWYSPEGVPSDSQPPPDAFVIDRVDPVGECITLRNTSSASASLKGWKISDGEGSYTFAYDRVISAGGTYTVCMDEYNPTQYTRGLYLSNKKDQVYLYDPLGELVDYTSWG